MNPSKESIDLIINFETGGKSYYEKVYKSTFVWPGGASGPTVGFGVDCAYYTREELKNIFKHVMTEEELTLVCGAVGKSGSSGQAYTRKLKGIIVTWDEAKKIFEELTLPKFINLAKKTFPGVENLHPNAQGAILSIIFNRGTSLSGSRRVEILALRRIIPTKNYKAMAAEVRKMKRLWPNNKNSNSDLYDRREAEAKLIEG
jgi:GH24 family phage-related lysozyme (muramidase)